MDLTAARSKIAALDAQARRHTTRVTPQASMAWRSWGEGPDLVLLHGGAGSWVHWIRNIEALAQHRTLWVPDMPGFGDSDLPRDGLDADTLAPYVIEGIGQLLKGATFDLDGFSFGSVVSGYIASLAPEKVRRLILTGGSGLGIHVGPSKELKSLRGVAEGDERHAILAHNLGAIMIHDTSHIDELAVAAQDQCSTRERIKGRVLARTDAMIRLAPGWKCPVHGIWGEDDNPRRRGVVNFDAAVAQLRLATKDVVPDAGHWVQFEKADVYNRRVIELLA
jgi:pimeloyl-ACP methyl ester carboxylesterase